MLIGDNLRCKITDFGMARDLGSSEIYVKKSNVSSHKRNLGDYFYCLVYRPTLDHLDLGCVHSIPNSFTWSREKLFGIYGMNSNGSLRNWRYNASFPLPFLDHGSAAKTLIAHRPPATQAMATAQDDTSRSHTSNIVPARMGKRVWCTKFYS